MPDVRPPLSGAAVLQTRPVLRRRASRVSQVSALCLAAAACLCLWTGWGQVPLWWGLVLAVVVGGSAVMDGNRQAGRRRWAFSLTEGALAVALSLATGAWAVAAVGLGTLAGQAAGHQPRRKRVFDVARLVLATALAQALAAALGGGVAAACAAMALFWLANDSLTAVAVSLTSRRPLRSLLRSGRVASALRTAGSCAVGLLAAYLLAEAPWGLLGLAVPLVLLWSSYDQQTHHGAQARLFAELVRSSESETARSADVSAQVVLTAAARLLGGADVELVLLAADGPVRYVGDETGAVQRQRADAAVFDEPWVLRALGEGAVAVGRDGPRPYVSAVLGDSDSPLAVLRAQRGPGSPAFDRNELRLTKVLVDQAGSWLCPADPAPPGAVAAPAPAPATAPALLVLRESADRLATLAGSSGEVEDIVEELHLVERAVVSLLGAVSLEAGQDPVVPPPTGALAPSRAGADWTTTGVLR